MGTGGTSAARKICSSPSSAIFVCGVRDCVSYIIVHCHCWYEAGISAFWKSGFLTLGRAHTLCLGRGPLLKGTEFDSQDAARRKSSFLQFASFLRGSQQLLVLVCIGSLVGRPSTPGDHWVTRAPGGFLLREHSPDPRAFTEWHLPQSRSAALGDYSTAKQPSAAPR